MNKIIEPYDYIQYCMTSIKVIIPINRWDRQGDEQQQGPG